MYSWRAQQLNNIDSSWPNNKWKKKHKQTIGWAVLFPMTNTWPTTFQTKVKQLTLAAMLCAKKQWWARTERSHHSQSAGKGVYCPWYDLKFAIDSANLTWQWGKKNRAYAQTLKAKIATAISSYEASRWGGNPMPFSPKEPTKQPTRHDTWFITACLSSWFCISIIHPIIK